MKTHITLLLAICVLIAVHSPLQAQQDGAHLFKTYCANCHEGSGADSRAPQLEVMKQMTPEHILEALEKGVMKAQAAERSRTQRRTLAEYLAGKPFGSAPPDLMQRSAFCSDGVGPYKNTLDGPTWNGWGVTVTNSRFQPAASAQLTADNVPRLKLKWAFGYPGATSGGTQPVVAGGRVYVGTAEGDYNSLDANTGCVHWIFEADGGIRSAISLGKAGGDRLAAFFGDQSANMYSVDAQSGKVLWKRKIDENSRAAITAAPALYGGRLYVGVSSREESQVGDPRYPCCEFRGSMVALDASDGKVLWKTYTISDEAHQLGKNSAGTTMWGPSGVPIWNSPSIDLKRNLLYAGTGNNYSTPATEASDAIIAFDMASGKIRWISQVAENDVWNGSCRRPDRSQLVCPDADAPDADVSSSPILVDIGGRQVILSGNKSGMLYALDPDQRGKVIWKQSTGKGSTSGGIMWGSAVDAEKV
jgi:polyvinyl alcohol dehydrogenase (cytochrome)